MTNDRVPKWPLIVSGILLALVGVVALMMQAANRAPIVKIPMPVLPNPNAYYNYVSATQMMRDAEKVGYAVNDSPRTTRQPTPPPTALPSPGPAPSPSPGVPAAPPAPQPANPLDHAYSLAEKEALVSDNAAALKELRQGFAHEYHRPPVRSNNAVFPELAGFRSLARVLVLEGQTRAGHGDYGGAISSYLDAVRLGSDLPKGGIMIDMLVGNACQAIGRRPAWKTVDKLSAGQARDGVKRMERALSRVVPFADTLQEDKWCTQATLIEMFRNPGWRGSFMSMASAYSAPEFGFKIQTLVTSKRRILSAYTDYMDACIANARQPYPESKPWPHEPNNPIFRALFPVFTKARFVQVRNQAENTLLAVTLALRAYRLEHGEYPASLVELSPGYLNRLPNDPFAKGILRYKLAGDKYTLYSVGPDFHDDGGQPVGGPVKPGAPLDPRQRNAQDDSKGDIVAGINQ